MHPVDYARTIQILRNDISHIGRMEDQLKQILTPATVMILVVTASTLHGASLSDAELTASLDGCRMILNLDTCRNKIVDYVRSRMAFVAPNLSAVVGSTTAAQLMGGAGGLLALSKVPACNLPVGRSVYGFGNGSGRVSPGSPRQMLGASKKLLAGMSTADFHRRAGFLHRCELIQSIPAEFRIRAMRILAAK